MIRRSLSSFLLQYLSLSSVFACATHYGTEYYDSETGVIKQPLITDATPPVRDQILVSIVPADVTYPLTVDENDVDGLNPLTRLGSTTPITAQGFLANGFDTKLTADLPSWAASATAPLSFHVIAKVPGPAVDWREVVANVSTASVDTPKLELATLIHSTRTIFALRGYNGTSVVTTRLNRPGWKFEFRYPERINGNNVLPQALCFLDANTLLLTGYAGSTSVLYRVDVNTGEYTGRAISTVHQHLNSIHRSQDGSVWMTSVVGGFDKRGEVDLATSFSTGTITVGTSWNTGDVPVSSLAFATVGGVEYVLASQYQGAGKIYVFLKSQMSGAVNQVDRVIRFYIGNGAQDLVQRASDGLLYVSRSDSYDRVEAYDLAAILAAGLDDASPTPVSSYVQATELSEGVDFHPTTDRLWTNSEGLTSTSERSHLAVWSSAMTGMEENSYLLDYLGGQMEIRLNGRLMHDGLSYTPGSAPAKIAIGAAPPATAGQTGFLTAGTVRGVAIKSVPFTQSELDALVTGM